MRGTGTVNDPYIITTAQELMSMRFEGSSGAHFALGADIDFCGCYQGPMPSTIETDCAVLDGRGHTIRNIYISHASQSISLFTLYGDINIRDLTFENLRITGSTVSLFSGGEYSAVLYRCVFSFCLTIGAAKSNGAGLINSSDVTMSIDLCSFVGRINWNKVLAVMFGGEMRRSQWDTDIFAVNMGTVYQSDSESMFNATSVTDCCFTGTFNITGTVSSAKYYYMSKQGYFSNCYAMFRGISNSVLNWQQTILSRCFVNNDLRGNLTFSVNALVSKLTDEQCHDAAYLRSIGFDCAEG